MVFKVHGCPIPLRHALKRTSGQAECVVKMGALALALPAEHTTSAPLALPTSLRLAPLGRVGPISLRVALAPLAASEGKPLIHLVRATAMEDWRVSARGALLQVGECPHRVVTGGWFSAPDQTLAFPPETGPVEGLFGTRTGSRPRASNDKQPRLKVNVA
jgi:hypothetical protein